MTRTLNIVTGFVLVASYVVGAMFCLGARPTPLPVAAPVDTNAEPEMAEASFEWDASPDASNSVIAYHLKAGTNEVWTTNTTASVLVPINLETRIELRAYLDQYREFGLASVDAGRTMIVTWSNWVEVVAVNPRLLKSATVLGPFTPTDASELHIPQSEQLPQEYFVAVADVQIESNRKLVEQ